jgi:hypothetical protein
VEDQRDAFSSGTAEIHERARNEPAYCKTLPAQEFPIIVAEWPRNQREIIRVALDQYNGRHPVNARIWYRNGEGVLKLERPASPCRSSTSRL